jgi:CubicO group peptidase (beta-lactamase class C family)
MATQNNIIVREYKNCDKPCDENNLVDDNQYVKDFVNTSLKMYSDMKGLGINVGDVKSNKEFSYYGGYASAVVDGVGNSNIDPITNTLKTPYDAWGNVMNDNRLKPITDDSLYFSTSFGKPLYALALMRLVDRGVINLGDPVIKYFPKWQNMKVIRQKFFNGSFVDLSGNTVVGCLAQQANGLPKKISDLSLNETTNITLLDGSIDTIANFVKSGRVQLVDVSKSRYAVSKENYYIEVEPIDLNICKTYGTVAMAFTHQIGLGLFFPKNKLTANILSDKGVARPNYSNTTGAISVDIFDTNYPSGYKVQTWLNEVLDAGLLSTMPGKDWEYDTGINIGFACCEIAYERFYGVKKTMPEILQELVINPLKLQNDMFVKIDSNQAIIIGPRIVCHYYAINSPTASNPDSQVKLAYIPLSSALRYNFGKHDLGATNFVLLNNKALKSILYMLANYGITKDGVRFLSKNAVHSMCEKNYLSNEVEMFIQDEYKRDQALEWFSYSIFNKQTVQFGIAGQVNYPRDGKVLNSTGENIADGFYSWGSSFGHVFYVKPSEGKYIIINSKYAQIFPFTSYVPTGQTSEQTVFKLNGLNVPPKFNIFGVDVALSLFKK